MAKYRAQILLEPDQHGMLVEIARNQNESISHVVREIVGEYLSGVMDREKRFREIKAAQTLKRLRGNIHQRCGVIEMEVLEQAREERSRDILNRMGGKPDECGSGAAHARRAGNSPSSDLQPPDRRRSTNPGTAPPVPGLV